MESYATLEFADEFLKKLPDGQRWLELSTLERLSFLYKATLRIDSLQSYQNGFVGKKLEENQIQQFPRDLYPEIPIEVKMACAFEAFAISNPDGWERRELLIHGVNRVSVGKASESYNKMPVYFHFLSSNEALNLLKPYLAGKGVFPIL